MACVPFRVPTLIAALSVACQAASWDPCKFKFGQAWDGPNATYSSESDLITIWLGNGSGDNVYNSYWEGDMLRQCKSGGKLAGKTPVIYSYIIAELAKVKGGLKDCDVAGVGSSQSLCTQGAKYITANKPLILQKYQDFAAGVAKDWGTSEPIVWMMEPDFFQYTEASSYWGTMQNPLSQADAASLMAELVAKVKTALPNAKISMDISPWVGGEGWQTAQTSWWNQLPTSSFSFRNTSGGRTQGNNDRIRSDNNNNTTWGGISSLSGLPVIADDGYGAGGGANGDWTEWMTAANLNSRITNGVVAILVPKPGDWTNQVKSARAGITAKLKGCGDSPAINHKLTLSTVQNGTLSVSPVQPADGYASGASVTVTATASNGFEFAGWSGACTGTGPCVVTMDAAKTVGATFSQVIPKYKLTLSTVQNGTLSVSPVQPTDGYASGASVTVAATASNGFEFAGWSGACTGTGPCVVTMDAAKTVGATFSQMIPKYKLTLSTVQNGTLSVSPVQPTDGYASGASVTVTAAPSTGFQFSGWSGACTGTGPCVVTMDAAKTVGATFSQMIPKYKLTLSTVQNGTLSVSPVQPTDGYASGASVTVTAAPSTGFQFSGWSGACTGTGPCVVTMDAAKTVGATFSQMIPKYKLTLSTVQNGTLSVSPVQPTDGYASGASVTVTAAPSTGFQFSGWSGACTGTGPCVVTMDAAKTVGATFSQVIPKYKLTLSAVQNGALSVSPAQPTDGYASGASVTVTATASNGFEFAGWSGACTGTGPCVVTMDAAKTVGATFSQVIPKYKLTLSTVQNGTLSVSPAQPTDGYNQGAQVTVTATASNGFELSSWNGACGGKAACVVTMDGAKTVGAIFQQKVSGLERSPLAGERVAVSGKWIAVDATDWGAAKLELRRANGAASVSLNLPVEGVRLVPTDRLPQGLWIAQLRGAQGQSIRKTLQIVR
ncbi:MAG: hypothetical protein IPO40_08760 [Fibrobacteres bacterium]|nr:hypothetical protein [Fibrobacterota bacterium]